MGVSPSWLPNKELPEESVYWDGSVIEAWTLGCYCGTLRNMDVAREPTWMYLRRSRNNNPMTTP
jgi:hypothetical protein